MARILLAPMEGMVDAQMRDVLTRASHYDWCVTEFARISASVPPAPQVPEQAPAAAPAVTAPAAAGATPVCCRKRGQS